MTHCETPHPDADRLRAFAEGTLSENDTFAIESHVALCDSCRTALEDYPDDAFAQRVRRAIVQSTPCDAPVRLQPGFELLAQIGSGGMGVVYKARQSGLNRLVALKRIHARIPGQAQALARFHREAEAIARLSHPNIVTTYEVGEQDGEPYLALELIEGGTLADRLSVPMAPEQAAALVESLARAVQHAHDRGIVHRDLKPSNILLDDRQGHGDDKFIPKISDFGLAKDTSSDSNCTQTGAIVGTPEYMSPEQADGRVREVGPASDVYSLGAILYACLTARPPFQGATVHDTLQQVLERDPLGPSRLQPKSPRDLDTICLKCLSKEPARRYDSAGALAEDLRRFRSGEPILAKPASIWQRGWKWSRRRPAWAALILVTSMLLLTLLIGGGVMNARLSAALGRESQERQRAQVNTQRALNAFQRALVKEGAINLADVPEMEAVRQDLLQDAAALYQELLKDKASSDLTSQLEHAEVLNALGKVQEGLGQADLALASFGEARGLLEALVADYPHEARCQIALAEARQRIGLLLRASNPIRAVQSVEQAIMLLEPIADGNTAVTKSLAAAYADLARLLDALSRPHDAATHHERALSLRENLERAISSDVEIRADLAASLRDDGQRHYRNSRWSEAERSYLRAVAILQPLAGDRRGGRAHQDSLGEVYTLLGSLYGRSRQPTKAEDFLDKATKLREQLVRQFPLAPHRQIDLARCLNNQAAFMIHLRRYADAESLLERARSIDEALVRENPESQDRRIALVEIQNNLAVVFAGTRRRDRAQSMYLQVIETLGPLVQKQPTPETVTLGLAAAHMNLGENLRALGQFEKSVAEQAMAEKILNSVLKSSPSNAAARNYLMNAYGSRAMALQSLNRHREAVADWDRFLDLAPESSRPGYRVVRMIALAAAGDHARVAEEAKFCGDAAGITDDDRYNVACALAVSSAAARNDSRLGPAERERLCEQYGASAVDLLDRLKRANYFRSAESRSRLASGDADLASLRERPDFRKLLQSFNPE